MYSLYYNKERVAEKLGAPLAEAVCSLATQYYYSRPNNADNRMAIVEEFLTAVHKELSHANTEQ